MFGGAYLCYEGTEKVYELLTPHQAHAHEAQLETVALNPQTFEDEKVAGAIKTDFILSAEIMAITLASVPATSLWTQALVLALVGIGITVGGLWRRRAHREGRRCGRGAGREPAALGARSSQPHRSDAPSCSGCRPSSQRLGTVGTAAMIWVGGSIIVHGLAEYGLPQLEETIHAAAVAAAHALPAVAGAVEWTVTAAGSGIVGLVIGAALIPVIGFAVAPVWKHLRRALWTRN